ncbi:2-amino-4-hydroxy-6-hydroxymethyldihydropteridine diphosphokinase [bacterium]|nr:2-amino-4-hydroxy-6-hydroxymethyldihydropteridine diphosphokinase [bacterium]
MKASSVHSVYLSLGSNIGDRKDFLNRALTMIGGVTIVSPFYETAPVGDESQDDFLNCAALIEAEEKPEALHQRLLSVEKQLGRERRAVWGPRTIDIDIIFFDDLIVNSDTLIIPHPRFAERNFVLVPLADIAPDFQCPVLKTTVSELLRRSPDKHAVKKIF